MTYGYNITVFNNAGTFRKSGSTGGNSLFTPGVLFNSTGKVDIQTNALYLQGSGNFTGGTATNLLGTLVLNAGNFNINGTVISTNVQLNGGVLVGANVLTGGFNWIVGDWNSATYVTIPAGSLLLVTSGADHNLANVTVTNNGTVAWSNGRIRGGYNGTVVYNYGLWDSQGDLTFNDDYGYTGTVFNNYGTFRKSAGTNTYTFITGGVWFNQLSGTVDVQTGELLLQGGANFVGGTANNPAGTIVLSSGSFNINGTIISTNMQLNGGALVGTNVLSGGFNWVVGDWNSAPSVTIPTGSILLVTSGADHNLANVTLTNNGIVAWSNGRIRGGYNGTVVYNNGLWDSQGDLTFNDDYGYNGTVFNNYGTFRKSAGTNTSYTMIAGGVWFNQLSGAVDVQTGVLLFQGGGNFTGGTATNNNGELVFSVGSFNLNGTLTGTNVVENSGNLVGANVVNGYLNWQAGNWQGATVTITTNSKVLLAPGGGANMDLYNCTVTNYGTFAWNSG